LCEEDELADVLVEEVVEDVVVGAGVIAAP